MTAAVANAEMIRATTPGRRCAQEPAGQERRPGRQQRLRGVSCTAGTRARAARLFAAKWGSVKKVVDFRARHGGLYAAIEDLTQAAGLALWKQCLKAADPAAPPFEINCKLIARAGFMEWKRHDDRHRNVISLGLKEPGDGNKTARGVPDLPRTIRVDDVELNVSDARLDYAVECDRYFGRLLTTKEAAAVLGVSRQYAHAIRKRLGAIRLGCRRWGFPPDLVRSYAERAAQRRAGRGER